MRVLSICFFNTTSSAVGGFAQPVQMSIFTRFIALIAKKVGIEEILRTYTIQYFKTMYEPTNQLLLARNILIEEINEG